MAEPITCSSCGTEVDPLELFPGDKCLKCHSEDPQVQRDLRNMTAEDLSRMWGGKP
jgi:predicted Zn-ribbon and HTH transcriptional regulator